MYNVSEQYKVEMKNTLREKTYVEIVFGVIDQDAPNVSTIVDNGHAYMSNVTQFDKNIPVNYTTETLEPDRFPLDGSVTLPNETDEPYQGFVGDWLSGYDKVYSPIPTISLTFSSPIELAALTFVFDKIKEDYPEEFQIIAYNNDIEAMNETYYPDSSHFITPRTIPTCNKILINFIKSNMPHRRARVYQLIYGIIETLTEADITKLEVTNKSDPISSNLPTQTVSFTMLDQKGVYDPEIPDSRLKYLEQGQFVEATLKQELSDGTFCEIPVSKTFSTGKISTEKTTVGTNVTAESGSEFSKLDEKYDAGIYYATGRSYSDLITDILTFAGYQGEYHIDESLSSITTKVVLTGKSCKECLQIILQASGCWFFIDREGILWIKKYVSPTDTAFDFTLADINDNPKLSRVPQIRSIISKYKSVSIGASATLATLTVDSTVTSKEFEISYKAATAVAYTKTSGLTVTGTPTISANKLTIILTGTGTVTVTGTPIVYSEIKYTKDVNQIGTDLEISNELIDSPEKCKSYCNMILDYYSRRNTYEFQNRGFPELDVGDNVGFETVDVENQSGIILEQTLTFDGTISSKTKLLSNSNS